MKKFLLLTSALLIASPVLAQTGGLDSYPSLQDQWLGSVFKKIFDAYPFVGELGVGLGVVWFITAWNNEELNRFTKYLMAIFMVMVCVLGVHLYFWGVLPSMVYVSIQAAILVGSVWILRLELLGKIPRR